MKSELLNWNIKRTSPKKELIMNEDMNNMR